ncbi:MAG TPA: translation initiation factor IF-2 [Candidatus Paceibacterota bacterium]|nr:translation initiation factor IF-2 [Candidatus Paceibacterota bacterium]
MSKPAHNSTERPPIVVVMGHVDHGKSTLLDFIRKSNVVAGEAGGITQHVAAYEVTHKDKHVTFIDTPGHAAFSAIRARGANVADIAILVVAADDGVKAQTLEALAQIREAKIPFIVAINKVDKPNADIDRTQRALLDQNVFLEKLGGDVPWVAISAKIGTGVDELLDLILLVAELNEMKADASAPASGYVIEAHRDQKRGIAATLIITNGTLEHGMAVLAGRAIAPVRIMEDHTGKRLTSATFSTPVTLVGFDELPTVGETFTAFQNKRACEQAREKLASAPRSAGSVAAVTPVGSDKFYLPVIIRADASGSLEAIIHEVSTIGDEHAAISIVQSGIGNISENDVKTAMAGASHAVLIGFNVSVDPIAEALALQHGVAIVTFNIIYKLTEHLEERLATLKPRRMVEEVAGRARVIKQFSSQKKIHVVGGGVTEGFIEKGGAVRIIRRKLPIGMGKVLNMQSNKQNVVRVEATSEFGAQIESKFEIAEGDIIEQVVMTSV